MIQPLSVTDLHARLQAGERFQMLDVREDMELAIAKLDGIVHIPLGELTSRADELDPDLPTVCICHHGMRSAHAAGYLETLEFEALFNLSGGVDAWAMYVDPEMARY